MYEFLTVFVVAIVIVLIVKLIIKDNKSNIEIEAKDDKRQISMKKYLKK
jgi:hypothetical protein